MLLWQLQITNLPQMTGLKISQFAGSSIDEEAWLNAVCAYDNKHLRHEMCGKEALHLLHLAAVLLWIVFPALPVQCELDQNSLLHMLWLSVI